MTMTTTLEIDFDEARVTVAAEHVRKKLAKHLEDERLDFFDS